MIDPIVNARVNILLEEREKVVLAARHGIIQRFCGPRETWSREFAAEVGPTPAGADDFARKRLADIAWEFCERSLIRPTSNIDAVYRAITMPFLARSSDGPATGTTGTYQGILADAQQLTATKSYLETESTYQFWCAHGESVQSYRDLSRVLNDYDGLVEELPENHEYPAAQINDAKETYRARKYGFVYSTSIEAVINDDIGTLRRAAADAGAAMRRSINADCYSLLLSNPVMQDGIELFHATEHNANLDSTALAAGAPLDVGYSVLGTMKSLDGTTIVGTTPKYLIVPTVLSGTALAITAGLYNGTSALRVITDGVIDDRGSTTNWWLAVDPKQRESIEYTFLAGEETPVVERASGFDNDTFKYKIRQSYGVKCIDYRGLYQGNS